MKSIVEIYNTIARHNPPWTAEEELDFIKSCTTDTGEWKSKEMKDKFVNEAMKHNIGLVFKMVKKHSFSGYDEDVVQRCMIAMVNSLKKYDPSKGYKISTWITNPIKWTIQQGQHVYSKERMIADEIVALNHKYKTDMSMVSIDQVAGKSCDGEHHDTLGDIISIDDLDVNFVTTKKLVSVDDQMREREIQMGVSEVMPHLTKFLTEKEMFVIKRMLGGKNMKEISVEMKVSKVRISQISASAFMKIRNSPLSNSLRRLIRHED